MSDSVKNTNKDYKNFQEEFKAVLKKQCTEIDLFASSTPKKNNTLNEITCKFPVESNFISPSYSNSNLSAIREVSELSSYFSPNYSNLFSKKFNGKQSNLKISLKPEEWAGVVKFSRDKLKNDTSKSLFKSKEGSSKKRKNLKSNLNLN